MSAEAEVGIPERLGSFYLGAEFDFESNAPSGPQLHYDARDLTTHAVCVGMTGSGKTGLCVGLLEEAALDGIPAIIIDPKGDMGNLLLHFPELRPADFEPWINVDDARRKEMSVDEFAVKTADLWRNGLAQWGIGPERLAALGRSVEYSVYTPGSESVRPVNILGSLTAPAETDPETLRDRVAGTVGALLGLLGIDADPVQSKEAIFLSVIFEHYWSAGKDLDLADLVRSVQNPPVRKFGVFDVDSFFPESDRFKLAMAINNLLASPSFSAWLTGEALDIDELLYRPDGTPKHSIFYIAHLSEPERMFFVTLLLNSLVTWVRQQPGTTSLRALLYFDEVFGFLPPVAVPPSKRPLLTLLKQARAFGVGTVLVTQNPVDLDYKALSNAGTWFIGRLQSKQDQQRLLDGLKTASVSDGSGRLSDIIGQLKSRVFVMNSVHEDEPVVFHTRWAMNYLRGPLTRNQLKDLVGETPAFTPKHEAPSVESHSGSAQAAGRPALPPGLEERFLQPSAPFDAEKLVYRPTVGAFARTQYVDRKYDIKSDRSTLHFLPPGLEKSVVDWSDANVILLHDNPLSDNPAASSAGFVGGLPAYCNTKADASALEKSLEDWIYRNERLSLLQNETLEICQRPDESESAFRGRVDLAGRERRDEAVDNTSETFQKKIARLMDKLRTVERSLDEQEDKYSARKQEEIVNLGETVLGMVFGRRRRLTGVATKRRMTSTARARLDSLGDKKDDLAREIAELEQEAIDEAERITLEWSGLIQNVTEYAISPRRTDIEIPFTGVLWLPYMVDGNSERPLF